MKKRWLSLLLSVTMLLSLVAVPTQAALVDGTATLTVTPNVTAVKAGSDAVEITYTITLTPPANKPVGPFQFTLVAPEDMTLSETELDFYEDSDKGGNGYWVNGNELEYDKKAKTGIYGTVAYAATTHKFGAYGLDNRSLTSEVDVMTIRATIAAGKVGNYTLDVADCVIGVNGDDYYTVNVSTTPVSVYSELDGAAVTGLTAPAKGGAPDGEVSSSDHTSATVAWFLGENAVTGNFAASTQYTAQITVTPDAGYRFADGASFTVDGASDWAVADGQNGAKVLTKTFPATADRSLLSISVTTAPNKTAYEVGDNFDATGMVVSAHYDEGEDDTNYTNYVVQGGENLAYGTTFVTIVSNEDSNVTTNTDITVSKKDLPTDKISITPTELTYNGEDRTGNVTVVIKDIATELTGALNVIYKISDQVVNEIKDAKTYDVYVSTNGGTMYNPLEQTKVGTVTVKKADASVTAPTAKELTYNGQAQELVTAGTTTGGTMQYKLGADGTYSTDIPTATDAGTYSVYYKVVGNDNYNGDDGGSVTVTIAKAAITPTVSIEGWTYGESAKTPGVTGNSGNGTVTYRYAAKGTSEFSETAPTNAGEYTVKATIAETANYLGGEATADFTISQADNSISNLTIDGWTYGEQAKDPSATAAFGTVAYTYSNAENGTFTSNAPTDAGTWYVKATVAGTTNYKGAEAVTSFIIAPKTVDVSALTWDYTEALTYNGAEQTVALAGQLPEGVTANYKNNAKQYVGQYEASVTFSPVSNNYLVNGSVDSLNWSIVAAAQNPTVEASRSLAKGGNTLDLTTLVSGNQGDLSFEIVSGGEYATLSGTTLTSDTTTGSVVITVKAAAKDDGGDSKAEYSAYVGESAITVTVVDKEQKTLTVTMDDWTYGDNAKTPGYTKPADSVDPVITYTGENYSSSTAPTNAGTYTVQVVCETATEIHTGSAAFTIAPRTAAITWSNTSFTYDGQSHVATATVSNKVGQDSVSATVSGAAVAAGSHTATVTGLDNANYVLPATAPTRAFTIAKRTAELNWSNTSFTYDGQSHVPTATVKNAVEGDTVTVTVTGEKTAAGSYTATAAELSNSNYALPTAKTQSFTINKRVAELNWSNTSFTYDGQSHMPTATVTNAVSGDTVTVTVSGGKTNAGTYSATATAISNKNYALGTDTGCDFTIAPKNISGVAVNLSAAVLTYNGKAQTKAVASVRDGSTTLSSGRDYTVSGATQTNAGHYELTVTGTGNYTGSKTAAWEIAPKAVTVTANNATKVYGAEDPALTAKVSGTVGSDTVAYTVNRAEGNDVGTYTITPAGAENQGNYTVTFKTGTFTITKANASVTSAPQAVTDLVFNGDARELVTAGKAEGGELQYKLGNGAYGTAIPTATEAGTYSVYYKVVGDKNHNSVSEARITVTIAPLSGNAVVTDGEVTASTEPDDTINDQLSGLEQYQTEALGLEEGATTEQVAAARLVAIRKDMTKAAGTSATNASALYYVDAGSSEAKVTFALPVSAATHNFKVMYMATNGVISPVTGAKVTTSGIEVPVAADGDGVYLVTYTNKPVSVDVDDDDTVKSAGTGDMGLVLYTVLAVSGATGAAWLGLKKRKED